MFCLNTIHIKRWLYALKIRCGLTDIGARQLWYTVVHHPAAYLPSAVFDEVRNIASVRVMAIDTYQLADQVDDDAQYDVEMRFEGKVEDRVYMNLKVEAREKVYLEACVYVHFNQLRRISDLICGVYPKGQLESLVRAGSMDVY